MKMSPNYVREGLSRDIDEDIRIEKRDMKNLISDIRKLYKLL